MMGFSICCWGGYGLCSLQINITLTSGLLSMNTHSHIFMNLGNTTLGILILYLPSTASLKLCLQGSQIGPTVGIECQWCNTELLSQVVHCDLTLADP